MSDVATSIVVVNSDQKDYLRALLSALKVEEAPTTEVIVVDNDSFDGSAEMVKAEFPRVRLLRLEQNHGFAHAANKALDAAGGDVAVLLRAPDVVTTIHVLSELADLVREGRPRRVAAVSARLYAPDKSELPLVARFPTLGR